MPAANDFGQKAMVVAAMAVSKATTLMKAVPGRWKPKKPRPSGVEGQGPAALPSWPCHVIHAATAITEMEIGGRR